MKKESHITFIKTLEQHQGDLLCVLSIDGDLYVERWLEENSDTTPTSNYYLLNKTNFEKVGSYMNKEIDSYSLMTQSEEFIIITKVGNIIEKIETFTTDTLPPKILPEKGVFHDISLRAADYVDDLT